MLVICRAGRDHGKLAADGRTSVDLCWYLTSRQDERIIADSVLLACAMCYHMTNMQLSITSHGGVSLLVSDGDAAELHLNQSSLFDHCAFACFYNSMSSFRGRLPAIDTVLDLSSRLFLAKNVASYL